MSNSNPYNKERSTARFDAWGDTPEEAFHAVHDDINRLEKVMETFHTLSASHTLNEINGRFFATALVIIKETA